MAVATEGARQAHEYDLSEFAVFGASNSGKTKELISLFTRLAEQRHARRFGLTANSPCTLETVSSRCYTLRCGKEEAVAATKSVVEQALFYRSLLAPWEKASPMAANRQEAARAGPRGPRSRTRPRAGGETRPRGGDLFRRPQQRRRRGTDAEDERNHAQEERLSSKGPTPCTASRKS